MDNANILQTTVRSRDARYLEKVLPGYQARPRLDTLVLQMLAEKLSSMERQLKSLARPRVYQQYQGSTEQPSKTQQGNPRRIQPAMLRKIFD